MENKPFVAVICGEVEAEKKDFIKKIIKEISDKNNMNFICISNPETNCHPKKQSLSAENTARHIAVKMQNTVMTTNSFHYLEAFLFYLQKHGAYGNVHFYLAENGNVFESDDAHDIMKNLSQPTFDLDDEKFAYELENDSNE